MEQVAAQRQVAVPEAVSALERVAVLREVLE